MNKKSCQNFSEENFFLSRKKKKIKSDEVSRGIVQIIINNKWLIHVEENVYVITIRTVSSTVVWLY